MTAAALALALAALAYAATMHRQRNHARTTARTWAAAYREQRGVAHAANKAAFDRKGATR